MLKAKLWGTTEDVLATPMCEVHRIRVWSGGESSWHHHERKANGFTVAEGMLDIEVESDYGAGPVVEIVSLGPGDFTCIPAGKVHRFINRSDFEVLALEIYYPESLGTEDIVRRIS